MRHILALGVATLLAPVCAAQATSDVQVDESLVAPRPLRVGEAIAASPDGYAAPTLSDVNGDGHIDLLIGDFGVHHGGFTTPDGVDSTIGGAAAQVQVLLGQGVGDEFRFGEPNWATTRDGKVQSPTW